MKETFCSIIKYRHMTAKVHWNGVIKNIFLYKLYVNISITNSVFLFKVQFNVYSWTDKFKESIIYIFNKLNLLSNEVQSINNIKYKSES